MPILNLCTPLQIREQRGDDQKKERGQRRPFQGDKKRVGSDRAQNRQQQSRKQQCDGQPNLPLRLREDTDRQDAGMKVRSAGIDLRMGP